MPVFHAALVPNPLEPIAGPAIGDGQRARRAKILAATRRLLAEGEDERLTLREVSESCGVAVQTIRNNFGRRDELIVSAVNEHTSAIWASLARSSPGAYAFIDFPHVIHHVATRFPGFLRASISLAFARSPALRDLQRHASAHKLGLLRGRAWQEELRPGVDLAVLATQITRLDTIMMYEWTTNGDCESLLSEMADAHRLLMLGALTTPFAAEIERHEAALPLPARPR